MSSLGPTLGVAAATVGALHALAPDHWVPVAAVARARGWSARRTAKIALGCGFGHVTVSAALGIVALVSGTAVVTALGARAGAVSGVLLIGFGAAYALWGARHWITRRIHGHSHEHFDHVHDAGKASVWTLFAIYCADPCVAVVPIVFAAAPLSKVATLVIVGVYELATMATMATLTLLAHAGASRLRARWIEHYGDTAAGALVVVTGIVVAAAGW